MPKGLKPYLNHSRNIMADQRPVFFFDIDNCLYSKNKNIGDYMEDLINQYVMNNLSLNKEDACMLNEQYYKKYGLAVEGLVRYHKIDPLDFNHQVDDALPLESILSPDLELQRLLQSFDQSKVKLWLFTNAYITHGKRVVRILGVDDIFEGITFCDYNQERITCKPQTEMYEKAMKEANITDYEKCYFVDDSEVNCEKAEALGWIAVHLMEDESPPCTSKPCRYQIKHLDELRCKFPQFFRANNCTEDSIVQ